MKKVIMSSVVGLGALALLAPHAEAKPRIYFGNGKWVELFQMVQVWNVYTITNDSFDVDMDARSDVYIRRGRIGFKGKIRKDMKFKVWFAYDNLGKNEATAGTGGPNTTGGTVEGAGTENREFYIWDAIWTWTLDPEWANISVGYFRPQVGKESITTAFKVISFQKALTNFTPRKHIVGRGPGRETGINIGGLALNKKLNFNIGIFDTNHKKIIGNKKQGTHFDPGDGNGDGAEVVGGKGKSGVGDGKKWSPLIAVRVAWSFGDPEHKKYKMGYTQTYYGKRKGLTIGLNYTYQGETDVFKQNNLYSIDILANYGPFDFNAEYDWLYRDVGGTVGSGTDKVWSVKAGYNFFLKDKQILRPAVMVSKEEPNDSNNDYKSDTGVSVKKELYEISLNWLINKDKLKLNISYDWGKVKNKDFSYIGMGLQLIY